MADTIDGRPIVRCFMVRVREDGKPIGAISVASLGAAYLAMCEGYAIIGPDPGDEIALAAWEREHAAVPFNPPKVS